MADTLKVSKEKKIEIIKYCIDHNHDYKGTAEFYGGNYAQIYNWVKKYESNGEDALEDCLLYTSIFISLHSYPKEDYTTI